MEMQEKDQSRSSRLAMRHPFIFLLPLGCAALCLLAHLCWKGRICMAGMGSLRCRAVKQLEKYQAIADDYAQLDTILEEGREKSQKEAAAEPEEMFPEMEADAEKHRQEYEAEMREKGLDAYGSAAAYQIMAVARYSIDDLGE